MTGVPTMPKSSSVQRTVLSGLLLVGVSGLQQSRAAAGSNVPSSKWASEFSAGREVSVATKTCVFQGCGKSASICDCQSRYYSRVCSTWY